MTSDDYLIVVIGADLAVTFILWCLVALLSRAVRRYL
jgi:hypothetical protein